MCFAISPDMSFESLVGRAKIACHLWAARMFIIDLYNLINNVGNTTFRAAADIDTCHIVDLTLVPPV